MLALRGMQYKVEHVYREANQSADFFAKQGESGISQSYICQDDLPQQVKGMIRLDFLGVPSLRSC